MILAQKIKKMVGDEQSLMEKYFTILCTINSIHLPPAQVKLLAFVARKGNISTGGLKSQFCEMSGYPKASLGNLIHRLIKSEKKWLIKQGDKIIINPGIGIGSCSTIELNITLHASQGSNN